MNTGKQKGHRWDLLKAYYEFDTSRPSTAAEKRAKQACDKLNIPRPTYRLDTSEHTFTGNQPCIRRMGLNPC